MQLALRGRVQASKSKSVGALNPSQMVMQLKLWQVSYSSYRGKVGTDFTALVLAETREDAILSVAGDVPRLNTIAKEIEGPFKNQHVLMTMKR